MYIGRLNKTNTHACLLIKIRKHTIFCRAIHTVMMGMACVWGVCVEMMCVCGVCGDDVCVCVGCVGMMCVGCVGMMCVGVCGVCVGTMCGEMNGDGMWVGG